MIDLNALLASPDACLLWTGYTEGRGYPVIRFKKEPHRLSRIVYRLFNGELGRYDVVRHTCDTPLCVNPRHLIKGTQADNLQDMCNKRRHWRHKRQDELGKINSGGNVTGESSV